MRTKPIILILIAIFLVGCSSRAQEGRIIAEVNGKKLTYEYLMDQFPKEMQSSMTQDDLAKAIENWIEMELLYQEALKHNIEKDRQALNAIDQARKSIIARRFLDLTISKDLHVSDAEIDSAYNSEKDKFTNNEEMYSISHIVLRNQGAAEAIYKRLKVGEDFAKLAADYSEDTLTMKKGGEIGFLPASALEKNMIDALNITAIGQFTAPLQSQSGYYHIFKLNDKKSSGTTLPLSEVKGDISQVLTAQKQQAAYDSIIGGLQNKAQIKRYPIDEKSQEKK